MVTWNFTIPASAVPGTLNFSAEFYPTNYGELIAAIKRIIWQPIVCTYCLEGTGLLNSLVVEYGNVNSKGGLSYSDVSKA